jgi:hypothetical protein
VGGGNYARFWKDLSLVFRGGLEDFGVGGGLTPPAACADGGRLRVAGAVRLVRMFLGGIGEDDSVVFGCACTPAFGRAEPTHRAKCRAISGAPGKLE